MQEEGLGNVLFPEKMLHKILRSGCAVLEAQSRSGVNPCSSGFGL
jgi:hypothetical protein